MTGGAVGVGQQQQGVLVAISEHGMDAKMAAARLAFLPESLLRAAEEGGQTRIQRRVERILVHVAEHEDPPGPTILHNGGEQAVHLLPSERCSVPGAQRRISIPHSDRNSFSSGMAMIWSWNTVAAKAPLAPASMNASRKCAGVPAPPDAMTGTWTASTTARV